MKFTYDSYIKSINSAIEKGFKLTLFHEKKDGLKMYLRHDVDTNLKKASQLAKLEYDAGFKSTYYILLTSDFYNIFSTDGLKCVKEIISYGHDIGVHFDSLKYTIENEKDMTDKILFEKETLETFFDIEIKSFSMHRPLPDYLNKDIIINGMFYTYSPKFMTDTEYVSDSRMRWKTDYDNAVDNCVKQNKNIQVLTHAFWYGENEKSINDICLNEFNAATDNLYNAFKMQISDFDSILNKDVYISKMKRGA
ncbi:MAG: hypothetical protein RSC10_09660 [Longicatena sp.]